MEARASRADLTRPVRAAPGRVGGGETEAARLTTQPGTLDDGDPGRPRHDRRGAGRPPPGSTAHLGPARPVHIFGDTERVRAAAKRGLIADYGASQSARTRLKDACEGASSGSSDAVVSQGRFASVAGSQGLWLEEQHEVAPGLDEAFAVHAVGVGALALLLHPEEGERVEEDECRRLGVRDACQVP